MTEGIKLSAKNDIDKNGKVGDNQLIKNIPTGDNLSQKAEDYYGMLLDRNSLFDYLPQNATMNDVLETMLVQLKTSINKEYKLYQQQSDSDRKQSILNVIGYQVAMLDEGRRQFNAGASIFRRVEENSSFQNARGSRRGLERDYRKRVSQIGTSHATPTGAAFDGFVDGAAELVEKIREHLRNPMRTSANLNTDTKKHSEKGAFFDTANMSFVSADVSYNEAKNVPFFKSLL